MKKFTGWIIIALIAALLILYVSPFASKQPDALEKTAKQLNARKQKKQNSLLSGIIVFH